MFSLTNHHDAQEWHADLLKWAERERAARRAQVSPRRASRTTGTALIWLGNRLRQWGQSLECRHAYEARDSLF